MKKVLCICLVFAMCLCLCACKSSDYKEAMALFEAGEYAQAVIVFETLGDYKDSAQKIADCEIEMEYHTAVALMDAGQYEEAIAAFQSLAGHKDSAAKIQECETAILETGYLNAAALLEAGEYEKAKAAFEALGDYKDSMQKTADCETAILNGKYNDAVALMDQDIVQAFDALISLDGYKDSAQKANAIYGQYCAEKRKAAQVGDYILFGAYEQDNNHANGKEYVEWLVLDKKGNKIFVLSKYSLDWQPYEEDFFKKGVVWRNCSLRKWLNDTFINTAFSSSEQSRIARTGQDDVFLLSPGEVNDYLLSESAKQCKPTAFAVAHGAEIINSDSGICRWWLRVESERDFIMAVDYSFVAWNWPVFTNGVGILPKLCIRPAIWISIEA